MVTGLSFQKDYDAYLAKWESLRPEIDAGIERNRKANLDIHVCDIKGRPIPGAKITLHQKSHAFDFGCNALMLGSLDDATERAYEDGITRLFNLITTTLCWSTTEYEEGKFRFHEGVKELFRRPPVERVIRFAKDNGLRIKGQPLMADSWIPAWASKNAETLKRQQAAYFQRAAEYLQGQVDIIDVHNEAFCAVSRTPHYPLLDQECTFVDWAFETVRGLFPPNVDLELNEATPVNDTDDWIERYYALAERLLKKRLPIYSLGLQFHMFNQDAVMRHIRGEQLNPNKILGTYRRYGQLGLPLYISEVTVPSNFEGSRAQGEAVQAEILKNLYRLWFSIPQMKGIIYWNLKDGPAWKTEGDCRGCLLDQRGREKLSYQTLYQLIRREWMTEENLETDAEGFVRVRGFKGGYTLIVEGPGRSCKTFLELRENKQSLTLKMEGED